jgi:hypothetical protein
VKTEKKYVSAPFVSQIFETHDAGIFIFSALFYVPSG